MQTHHAYLVQATSLAQADIPERYKTPSVDTLHITRELFSIDDARELTVLAQNQPFADDTRVFVIVAHDIAVEAQNALLKLFEEPPTYARFYVVLGSTAFILPTLRSRLAQLEDNGTHAVLENTAFASFKSASYGNRIAEIAEKVKQKDADWIESILQGYEEYASKPRDTNKTMLQNILFVRTYIRSKGASAKMLLEELALSLPIK